MERNGLNFNLVNNSGMKLIHTLTRNLDFLKLSKFLVDSPISKYARYEELAVDLISDSGTQNGLFILTTSVEPVLLETKVYIQFFPYKPFARDGLDIGRSTQTTAYALNLYVPNDYALIEQGTQWRGLMIMDEIAKSIHGKHITGVGRVEILDWELGVVKNNPAFSVYAIVIGVNHATTSRPFEK